MKENFETASYVLGIISIVLAFFTPLAGLILGIIGLRLSKRQKSELSKKAKRYNTLGIILSLIFFIITIIITIYLTKQGINNLPNFPIA
ncbi:hypothetical protein CMI49_01165 [Candidatus Pacearchaeota archaeon]|jgi:uncharacterized membrane protein|nr:hypothetical protein [Candidatus Pacearchaeota archaeon]|tara:strand:+ start:3282 stop:3548 length:267 start_codon:yes stop_codon:yes gene_type:complete